MRSLTVMRSLVICLLAPAVVAIAQDQSPAPAAALQEDQLSAHNRFVYGVTQKILLRAAETMPEENYSFKPTDAVRSFGQIVGHISDSQYTFCSAALAEKNPAPGIEKTKTSKADLIAALKNAFAYCERAYVGLTDESGARIVKLMGTDAPKLGVLYVNQMHTFEHYGNLVTYMRMKNLVPPTSEPEFMRKVATR